MPSPLRLLLTKPTPPGPRNIQRDVIALATDDGSHIDVLRVRDPRARRLRLSVDERGARLTQPPRTSLDVGERFVREHLAWLRAQLAAHAIDGVAPLERGATAALPLGGVLVPLRWEPGRYACVQHDGDDLVFRYTTRSSDEALRRALRDFYESRARADVGRWLPPYLPGLPRAPSRLRVKPMSSQWGSLAPDGTLALDLALVLGRASAFEYVLVHELCHLVRADHSPAFWAEVEARCPHWREERDYFRSEGRRLKAALRTLLSAPRTRD
jgi:predicted metal-dependent hydrolase